MTTYSAVRTTGIYCRPGCGAKPRPYRVAGTVADEAPELVCRAVQQIALRLGARDAWPLSGESEHLGPSRSFAAVYQLINAS